MRRDLEDVIREAAEKVSYPLTYEVKYNLREFMKWLSDFKYTPSRLQARLFNFLKKFTKANTLCRVGWHRWVYNIQGLSIVTGTNIMTSGRRKCVFCKKAQAYLLRREYIEGWRG